MNNIYSLKWSLTSLCILLYLPLLLGAQITVTSTADSGMGSLRDAIATAADGDEILFDASTDNSPIILLTTIILDKDLIISGNGMNTTMLSGDDKVRLFDVAGTPTITIRNLALMAGATMESGGALQNATGDVTLRRVLVTGSEAAGAESTQGGGGLHNASTMVLEGCMITDNIASGAAGSGGGILNSSGGALRISSTEISGNEANRAGGGIEDASGGGSSFVIANSVIDNNVVNTSPGNGGGIHIGGDGSLTISGGSVSGNSAGQEGGGIWNNNGVLDIRGGTVFDGNVALGDDADDGGGALFQNGSMDAPTSGRIVVRSGTMITNNMATGTSGSGGGIQILNGGGLIVVGSTITGNTANRAGGGIEDASNDNETTLIINTTIDDNTVNTAPGNGGGIHIGGNGSMVIRGGTISGNSAGQEGGGAWNNNGIMDIGGGTVIDGNMALGADADDGGGGLFQNGSEDSPSTGSILVRNGTMITNNVASGDAGSGGGIQVLTGGGLTVVGSTITGNTANRAGGGIEDASGGSTTVLVVNSTVDNNVVNTAPGNGGGIHVGGDGNLSITGGTVSNNEAGREGGGLWNGAGTMTVRNVTIDGNTALGEAADQGGAGLFNVSGTLNVISSTVTNNVASGASASGGGLLSKDGDVDVRFSTFMGNVSNRAGGAVELVDGTFRSSSTDYMDNVAGPGDLAAPGNGGAFHITGMSSTVTFVGGTVSGNTAGQEGGGLWNQSGTTMNVNRVTFTGNEGLGDDADDGGGALFNNGGTLNVMASELSGNIASGTSGSGGGILSVGGDVTVMNSVLEGNTAVRAGGGVEIADGAYSSTNTDYTTNTAEGNPGSGGALHVTAATTVDIIGGDVSDNVATATGGGLWNNTGSTMTVDGVSIMGNMAGNGGGGVWNNGGTTNINNSTIAFNESTGGQGGGVYTGVAATSTVNISTSTISTNTGAGIFVGGASSVDVANSTVALNTGAGIEINGGTNTVNSTLFVVNTAGDVVVNGGSFGASDYNLTTDGTGSAFAGTNNINMGLANAGPLADNGGMTMTHALLCGSDAIDAGNPTDSSDDQIGQSVFNGTRDIGAFELQTGCGPALPANVADVFEEQMESLEPTEIVSAFPNPAIGNDINIQIPDTFGENALLRVVNANGTVRVTRTVNAGLFNLPLGNVPAGTYTIQVLKGDQMQTTRVMVMD